MVPWKPIIRPCKKNSAKNPQSILLNRSHFSTSCTNLLNSFVLVTYQIRVFRESTISPFSTLLSFHSTFCSLENVSGTFQWFLLLLEESFPSSNDLSFHIWPQGFKTLCSNIQHKARMQVKVENLVYVPSGLLVVDDPKSFSFQSIIHNMQMTLCTATCNPARTSPDWKETPCHSLWTPSRDMAWMGPWPCHETSVAILITPRV